jgi:hypothetical protein
MRRLAGIVAGLLLAFPAAASAATCHVSVPPASTTPGASGGAASGSGGLWVGIPPDGVFTVAPDVQPNTHFGLQADGSVKEKLPWWGSKKASRRLVITGRRLDQADAHLRTRVSQGSRAEGAPHFWPSYVWFAHPGCWRITARAGKARLRMTVLVRLNEKGPGDPGPS